MVEYLIIPKYYNTRVSTEYLKNSGILLARRDGASAPHFITVMPSWP